MRLSEAIEALCIATRADGGSPRTVESYRQKLKPLLKFLGDVLVEDITIGDLRSYIASMWDRSTLYPNHPTHRRRAGHLSPFTIASNVTALKRLFNWLTAEGVLQNNPAQRIKTQKPKRKKPKGVDKKDIIAMLAAIDGVKPIDFRDRAIILFLADTGCRVGGLCGLRMKDLDLDAYRATVTEKGGKTRLVFFTPTTAKALAAWLEVRPDDKGSWVFIGLGTHSEGQMSANGVLQALNQRAEKVGATGPTNPHAFRHGFARHFLLDGGDLATLADILGNTIEVVVDYYAIFTAEELQRKHLQHSPVADMFGGGRNGDS